MVMTRAAAAEPAIYPEDIPEFSRALRDHGGPRWQRKLADDKRAVELFNAGVSMADIGVVMGCSERAVYARLRRVARSKALARLTAAGEVEGADAAELRARIGAEVRAERDRIAEGQDAEIALTLAGDGPVWGEN